MYIFLLPFTKDINILFGDIPGYMMNNIEKMSENSHNWFGEQLVDELIYQAMRSAEHDIQKHLISNNEYCNCKYVNASCVMCSTEVSSKVHYCIKKQDIAKKWNTFEVEKVNLKQGDTPTNNFPISLSILKFCNKMAVDLLHSAVLEVCLKRENPTKISEIFTGTNYEHNSDTKTRINSAETFTQETLKRHNVDTDKLEKEYKELYKPSVAGLWNTGVPDTVVSCCRYNNSCLMEKCTCYQSNISRFAVQMTLDIIREVRKRFNMQSIPKDKLNENFIDTSVASITTSVQISSSICNRSIVSQVQLSNVGSLFNDDATEIQLCDTFLNKLFSSSNLVKTNGMPKPRKLRKQDKKKKKLLKNMQTVEVPTYEEMGFWTSNEEKYDANDSLCCPVCFDVYYNPYECMPCTHSFCEPCLRRLAKYSHDNRRENTCPICREPISYCRQNEVLKVQVEMFLPSEYRRRQKVDGSSKYMTHPLPSKRSVVNLTDIARAVSQRNRGRRQIRPRTDGINVVQQYYWKVFTVAILCLLCKFFIILGVIYIYHYFSKDEKIDTLHGLWLYIVNNVWNYSELDEDKQVKVSNLFVVIGVILLMFASLTYFSRKRLVFVPR